MAGWLKQIGKNESPITKEALDKYIEEHGIVYGVIKENVSQVIDNRAVFPIIIAKGTKPQNGENAYLLPIFPENCDKSQDENETVDLREVKKIPSVTQGSIVGKKVDKVDQVDGMDILGNEVKGKPPRDFILRPGKNTRVSDDNHQIISLIDGQIVAEKKVIHVFPVYEINGDLDLKEGNVDFVGNVNIRGSVPSGFKIKAKGDVRIHGSVEGAEIEAGGSIYINQGVVAQGKGLIKAHGDLHTSFINQGNIHVDGDVHVLQSILHSNVSAQKCVYCYRGRGNIVGGKVFAGKGIVVNEAGNSMSTPTTLFVGVNQHIIEKEAYFKLEIEKSKAELEKMNLLLQKISSQGSDQDLSPKLRIMKLRLRNTIRETETNLLDYIESLSESEEIFDEQLNATVKVKRTVYPNTSIHYGKYKRKIISKHQSVVFKFDKNEIIFDVL